MAMNTIRHQMLTKFPGAVPPNLSINQRKIYRAPLYDTSRSAYSSQF